MASLQPTFQLLVRIKNVVEASLLTDEEKANCVLFDLNNWTAQLESAVAVSPALEKDDEVAKFHVQRGTHPPYKLYTDTAKLSLLQKITLLIKDTKAQPLLEIRVKSVQAFVKAELAKPFAPSEQNARPYLPAPRNRSVHQKPLSSIPSLGEALAIAAQKEKNALDKFKEENGPFKGGASCDMSEEQLRKPEEWYALNCD